MSASADPTSTALVRNYPEAVESPVAVGSPASPIELFSGTMLLAQAGESFRADGRVCLDWLPTPKIRFTATSPEVAWLDVELGPLEIRLDADSTEGQPIEAVLNRVTWGGDSPAAMSGVIDVRVIRPVEGSASYATFVLPNFPSGFGRPVRYSQGGVAAARHVLRGSGWVATIDECRDEKKVQDALVAGAGFGVTHVGRIERQDGTSFTAADSDRIIIALGWYLSFAAGRWVCPCLLTGFSTDASRLWSVWDIRRVDFFRNRQTWLCRAKADHLEEPFEGFLSRWFDQGWDEVVRLAIHWYVEANACAGSIEGSIALTQTAFELLSSAALVEQHGWLSTDGYDKLPAADRIRLLFRWAGIPTDIPVEAGALAGAARAENWSDLPTAMTAVRNTIIHPTKKNRDKYGKHDAGVRWDVWRLGLWALELCLLRLFGYQGVYSNRVRARRVEEVETVPWAVTQPSRM